MGGIESVKAAVKVLLTKATPVCSMPTPWEEDRRYSESEIEQLEADIELRLATQALIDLLQ